MSGVVSNRTTGQISGSATGMAHEQDTLDYRTA